jgi:O-antigen/teichoic acid export membrane protein
VIEKLTALARSRRDLRLGNYGVKLVGFLLIPVYTRYLAPADYGVMALVSTFGQALFIFLNLGQSTALFRFYYEDDTTEGRERVIAGSL